MYCLSLSTFEENVEAHDPLLSCYQTIVDCVKKLKIKSFRFNTFLDIKDYLDPWKGQGHDTIMGLKCYDFIVLVKRWAPAITFLKLSLYHIWINTLLSASFYSFWMAKSY
jgi:hypothetical protein